MAAPFAGGLVELGWGRAVMGPVIGDGGMGTVYRGWLYYNPGGPRAGTPPHEVAIKMLHPSLSGRPHVRQLFQGEAQALAQLAHPNIVHFYGLAESHGQLALVIEFVAGQSLDAVIERNVRCATPGQPVLQPVRAWHYFQQLLGALAATHALGIVHRDVKPANLLIRWDGLAKLTDFGIARLPADMAHTTGGLQPGTGAYMSPEQVNGQPLDGRSDLYSAAIVLYEMLTGHTPFEHGNRNELMIRAAQLGEMPPPLTAFLPQAPPALTMAMARALAKHPDHRYSNAIEMGNAFRTALQIPETSGWQAQQALAASARSIADAPEALASEHPPPPQGLLSFPTPRGKGKTEKMPVIEADRMRAAVASAYFLDTPSLGR
ncbi:MAG: serine/threonine-protein kinase [Myxococcales bacterium]|nr:serine/threonine protein kinase [Polyangiaceae bacterium]MDW8249457.1 serine/threonine-protein kinase [Myxococcales bacterium]